MVFIERKENDNTFHTFSHCDLTDWSIYWGNGVRWHLSYIFSLWSYSILSINTSFNEVRSRDVKDVIVLHPLNIYFIQWGHKEKRCERCHRTPYWGDRVRWYLSHLFSLLPHCMKYLFKGWSTMTSFTSLLVISLYEVFIEWMEYNNIFHISVCGLIVWNIYWGDGVPFNKYFIQWGHNENRCERCDRTPSPQ
jgi:hypothetical protein